MKNKIYIIGLLSCLLIIAGGIMKINHLAGAGIVLVLGIFTLCAVFLPVAVRSSFKDGGRKKAMLFIAIFITILADFAGGLFKIMHWPGAGFMMMIGIIAPIVVFLPVYLYFHFKEQEESQTNFLYIMFLLVYLSAMSALLSINVSKDILDDSIRSENIKNLNDYYQLKNEISYTNEKITELKEKTAELLNYIHSVKVKLVLHENEENKAAVDANNKINVFKITNKDSKDATGTIMFGEEAFIIKKKINDYRQYLVKHSMTNQLKTGLISLELLNTNDIGWEGKRQISWELHHFGDLPLILVIQRLTELENNIILAETEMITRISKT